MTAHALKGDRERCLVAGMDGYIAKPVKEEELLATVESWGESDAQPESLLNIASNEPVLNWHDALDRMRGRQALLVKMMSLFQNQLPQLLVEINQAMEEQDAETLRRSAHTLKSSANSIGAFELATIAEQLENSGQEADFGVAASTLVVLQ